jgi:hypothetical protein
MTVPQVRTSGRPQPFDWPQIIRRYLSNRWVLLAIGGGAVTIAAFFNWGWLVAIGLAPIIIAFAPCAIMCGLGLCGMKMMGGSCEKQSAPSADVKDTAASSSVMAADWPAGEPMSASNSQGQAKAQVQLTQQQTINERSESHA